MDAKKSILQFIEIIVEIREYYWRCCSVSVLSDRRVRASGGLLSLAVDV